MDAEWKRKWVEALRSGKYRQGRSWLHREDRFCCLGVLCELVREEHGGEWQLKDPRAPEDKAYTFDGEWDYLPSSVAKITGLERMNPSVPVEDGTQPVAMLNDEGVSFLGIADLIEKHL